jgi:hypothetical protein
MFHPNDDHLLADSNAMRHPGLKAYLGASRDHAIALSDQAVPEPSVDRTTWRSSKPMPGS